MRTKIVFLVGPTAIGKTEISVALARKINAEIISCDSMQVYKGMDTITSKPTLLLRKIIPHHLISIVSPDKEYCVFRYYKEVCRKIKEIQKRSKIPLVVGGSGLYMSILIDGIFQSASPDKVIRNRLYRQAKELGGEYLYNRLKNIDPKAALKIHPHDTKRIIRALEVFETTTQPISKLQKQRKGLSEEYEIKIFGLNRERHKLYQRIEKRVDRMFAQGLVSEIKRLLKLKLSKTARCAIGLKEIKGYLDGLYDLEEAKCLIKRNTRLYAKRQLTWFRKDRRIDWLEIRDKEKPTLVANRIFKKLLSRSSNAGLE
jgi:tRNA dimethylallyltransferase